MNKLTVLTLVFFILISVSGIGAAAEIIVKPGDSIQNSINSATSGDTIIVKPGTYTDNIKIVKNDLPFLASNVRNTSFMVPMKSIYFT